MRKFKLNIIILGIVAALMMNVSALYANGNKTIVLAMTNAYETLNPFGSSGNYTDIISDMVFDRLVVSNIDGSCDERLAERYEVESDRSAITFYLNKNAKFHDGVPVTADDVVFSARLNSNPHFLSLKRNSMRYFAGTDDSGLELSPGSLRVEKVDDYAVKFVFKRPINEETILTLFNRYFYVVPKHVYGKYTPEQLSAGDLWKNNMVGSGPLKYESSVDGERVEFTVNKDYYLGGINCDRVILRVVESSQLLSGLLAGEIDVVVGGGLASIPLSDWPAVLEENDIVGYSGRTYGYQAMIVNMKSKKLASPKIRNAINMAINRELLTEALMEGEASVMYGMYQNYHPYYKVGLEEPVYNPEKAKRQLEEAGYDFSQTLDLIVPIGNEIRIQSTVLIQQDLAAIGVKTNITQYDFATLMQKMRTAEFDLGMCGSAGSVDPSEPYVWLNWQGVTNFPCLYDDTYSVMFEDATYELDPAARKDKFARIQAYEMEDSPIIYLYSQNSLLAYNSKRVSNMDPDKFGQLNWCIWDWKVAD